MADLSRTQDQHQDDGRIFVISGPGGAGKGTIVSKLLEMDSRLWLSRSWTTRARRPGESSDSYEFVDREKFLERVEKDGFLEYAEFLGNLYGSPLSDLPPGKDLVLEIEMQGAAQVRKRRPDAVVIFVTPPSREVQEQRLRTRGDTEQQVAQRLSLASLEEAAAWSLADAVIVNDDLDRAVKEVADIIHRTRSHGDPSIPGDE